MKLQPVFSFHLVHSTTEVCSPVGHYSVRRLKQGHKPRGEIIPVPPGLLLMRCYTECCIVVFLSPCITPGTSIYQLEKKHIAKEIE